MRQAALGDKLINCLCHSNTPPAGNTVVISRYETSGFKFSCVGFEVGLDEREQVVPIDGNPVEIVVGEVFRSFRGRKPMYRHGALRNLAGETPDHRMVTVIQARLAGAKKCPVETTPVLLPGFEFPWVDQVQFARLNYFQYDFGEMALMNVNFCANRLLWHLVQQKNGGGRD